jgi:hypothetical protein
MSASAAFIARARDSLGSGRPDLAWCHGEPAKEAAPHDVSLLAHVAEAFSCNCHEAIAAGHLPEAERVSAAWRTPEGMALASTARERLAPMAGLKATMAHADAPEGQRGP